jgi:chaperone required for assembly of F1-ATPase
VSARRWKTSAAALEASLGTEPPIPTATPAARRFYKEATTRPGPIGWCVALDGRVLKSPAKRELYLPSQALAEAIAAEWNAQGEKVNPASMPLMQLASTAIDRVATHQAGIVDEVAGYAATDLVCYRAGDPPSLVERQSEVWDPLIAWLRQRFDASLNLTTRIVPVDQPPQALAILRRTVEAQDDFRLAALAVLTSTSGSLVIGLAVAEGRLTAAEGTAAAQLDELYQAGRWGEDAEAASRRRLQAEDMAQARRFLDLLALP